MNEIKPNSRRETWVGALFSKKGFIESIDFFWIFTCPCGVDAVYGLNKLPEVKTKHPGNNPKHWTIDFEIEND